jgi:hypothetical protein
MGMFVSWKSTQGMVAFPENSYQQLFKRFFFSFLFDIIVGIFLLFVFGKPATTSGPSYLILVDILFPGVYFIRVVLCSLAYPQGVLSHQLSPLVSIT